MKVLVLLLTTAFFAPGSYAQDQHLIDSLTSQLKNHNAHKMEMKLNSPSLYDTTAANILSKLSAAYWDSNPDKAMDYANQCLALSEQIGYKKGVGHAYNNMGWVSGQKGDYLPALEFHKKALKTWEEIGYKKGMATSYNNMGVIYDYQGNYPEALKNYFACLKSMEEIGNKRGIAVSYTNIGNIYSSQGNHPEALKNYFASLKLSEETGDKDRMVSAYTNIGGEYCDHLLNYSEALKYFFMSLKLAEEIGDKNGMATLFSCIGNAYAARGNDTEALKYFFASLKEKEELGNKEGIAYSCFHIGNSYAKQKKYGDAYEYLNKGLSLAKQIGSLEWTKLIYASLATLDSAQGNFRQAFANYKLYITTRDSLVNNENTEKTVALQLNYDFSKKQDSLNLVQASKDVVSQKELEKQKLVRNAFVGGTLLFLLLAGAIFMGWRKTGKAKKKSEELLLNILPTEIAEEIKVTGRAKAKAFTMVTVMLTDFKDFTTVSEKISAELLVDEIHTCFSAFDNILHKYNIEKIKTIGDAYLCASGLPVSTHTHAEDMLHAAFEIRNFMLERKKEKQAKDEIPFELRIGIHTGPVVAGVVGVKKYAYDIWGDTVNIAARMEQNSDAGKINISGTTYNLVRDKFKCEHRGKIQAKNKGEIDMYFVETA